MLAVSIAISVSTCTTSLYAQTSEKHVTGVVVDENSAPLMGVTVYVDGTSVGVSTDIDGRYSITLPEGHDELVFSYIGYTTQTIPVGSRTTVDITMKPDTEQINEVVVIGYGTVRKGDLTGAVSTVSDKDFNEGLISSPEQLINGKIAGVQIMQSSGSPNSGSTIRIRGGASLNASNDPLIVLDGVPLEIGGISGNSSNFLSLINPNDIESMTVLKDASSTAIYGSRASNGVIIITTKKGSGNDKLKISFSTTNSLQTRTRVADMLSADEFIGVINSRGTEAQKALLGDTRTDWNDEIYKTAFGTDNNLSVAGRFTENFPFRFSAGYYNQDGILRTDNAERWTGSISLSPSFFKDYLKFNISVKGALNNNRFAQTDAVWGAAAYNPTVPVYSGSDAFGGYTEGVDAGGTPVIGALANPVALLKQFHSTSQVYRVIGNFDVDYKMHFLPDLRFHATLGYDYADGRGKVFVPKEAFQYYTTNGRDYSYGPEEKHNRLLTTYLNYNKHVASIKSTFDVTVGYDYQAWKDTSPEYYEYTTAGEIYTTSPATYQEHVLLSFYGRLNYTYDDRYMLTATIRRDGTSRFSKDNRWGTFPSVAVAWRISNESFLRDSRTVSNLKLRASFGVTGQQDNIGNYSYIPTYTLSQTGAQYIFGGVPVYTYRPEAYMPNLKWETTESWNVGLDFGFFNNRLSGSIDYYTRRTKDLLASVPAPAGSNFDKTVMTNVGNIDSEGVELTINAVPVDTEDWTWNIGFNASWQRSKITNLSLNKREGEVVSTPAGTWIDDYYFQTFTEGQTPYAFYVYKQLYDESGKPLEGRYADIDGDGQADRYFYHSPAPDYILGFTTSIRWKKLTLSTSLRANIGNYVYNGMAMNTGAFNTVSYNAYQLNNLNRSYLKTGFTSRQYLSDYYVENASFLKMDNLILTYNIGNIAKWCRMNVSAMVQNVFTITKYSGVDPEVPGGIDSSFYPRPRIYSLSVGFEF